MSGWVDGRMDGMAGWAGDGMLICNSQLRLELSYTLYFNFGAFRCFNRLPGLADYARRCLTEIHPLGLCGGAQLTHNQNPVR